MATVQGAELLEVIVDGGESAKNLNRRGLQHLVALVDSGTVEAVIIAKLDWLTRSVKDLCGLLELFERTRDALRQQAHERGTGREYPARIPSQPGRPARRTRPWRAGSAHRDR